MIKFIHRIEDNLWKSRWYLIVIVKISEYRILFSRGMNKSLNTWTGNFFKKGSLFLFTRSERKSYRDQSVSKDVSRWKKTCQIDKLTVGRCSRHAWQRGRGRIDRQRANDNNIIHPPLVLHIATRSHPNESFQLLFQLSLKNLSQE